MLWSTQIGDPKFKFLGFILFYFIFLAGSHYKAQAVQELIIQIRLTSNAQRSPVSAFQVRRLKTYFTMPSIKQKLSEDFFFYNVLFGKSTFNPSSHFLKERPQREGNYFSGLLQKYSSVGSLCHWRASGPHFCVNCLPHFYTFLKIEPP